MSDSEEPRPSFGLSKVKFEKSDEPLASTSSAGAKEEEEEEEEEDDYMSADFLSRLPDVRPGVVGRATAKRYAVENAMRERNASRSKAAKRELEEAQRSEALAKPVPSHNKGFELLAKMGYTPGTSLGKKDGALKEPLPLELKNDRKGLGHEAELKRKAEALLEEHRLQSRRRKEAETELLDAYRLRKRDAALSRRIEGELGSSAKACMECDQSEGVRRPTALWFWPRGAIPEPIDPDTGEPVPHDYEESLSSEAKLSVLTAYLRESHSYCVWCGRRFAGPQELANACPGSTREHHEDPDL